MQSLKQLLTSACPDLLTDSDAEGKPHELKSVEDMFYARTRRSQINMMESLCNHGNSQEGKFSTGDISQKSKGALSPKHRCDTIESRECIPASQDSGNASSAAEKLLHEVCMQMEIYAAVGTSLQAVEKWQKKVKKWQTRATRELEVMADFMSAACSKFESINSPALHFTDLAAPIVTRG